MRHAGIPTMPLKMAKTVGILQLVEHGSLDAAYEGFKEGLAEGGYKEGENLTLEYQNAQNSQDNLKSMSEKLVKILLIFS